MNPQTPAERKRKERAERKKWLIAHGFQSVEGLLSALMKADPKEVAALLRNIKTDTHRK